MKPEIDIKQLAIDATAKWGEVPQLLKAAEECSELSVEIMHLYFGRGSIDRIAEEAADVEVTLASVREIVGHARVDSWVERKANRLRRKIERQEEAT